MNVPYEKTRMVTFILSAARETNFRSNVAILWISNHGTANRQSMWN